MKFTGLLVLALALTMVSATVTSASSPADIQSFAAENIKNHHTHGLYFTDKDEGFFNSMKGLFSSDKETEFKNMLIDTDEVSLLNINVNQEEMREVSTEMNIQEYPYIVVYFNGEQDHNIHGPANEQTALQIIEELERISPQPITVSTAVAEPVTIDLDNTTAETEAEHAEHGSLAGSQEAHVDNDGSVSNTEPANPAAPQQPTEVSEVRVTPALESSGAAVEIKPKELGEWTHEAPRHEAGYIEELGFDDVLDDSVWARQIKSALPVMSYDVYPEPHQVINPVTDELEDDTFIVEHFEPVIVEEVFIEAPEIIYEAPVYTAPLIIEEPVYRPAVTVVEEPTIIIQEPTVVIEEPVFRPTVTVVEEPVVVRPPTTFIQEPVTVRPPTTFIQEPIQRPTPVVVETPQRVVNNAVKPEGYSYVRTPTTGARPAPVTTRPPVYGGVAPKLNTNKPAPQKVPAPGSKPTAAPKNGAPTRRF